MFVSGESIIKSRMKIKTRQNELDEVAIPDLRKLKELSDRLHLPSKRESVIIWQKDLQELQSEGVYPWVLTSGIYKSNYTDNG